MRIRRLILATLLALTLTLVLAGAAFAQEGNGGDNGNGNGPKACTGRGRRACEIPEVPIAAAIPVVGLLGVAGYVIVDHRRRKAGTPSA
jgi:hypothetical protein